jgi:hypothetical protein
LNILTVQNLKGMSFLDQIKYVYAFVVYCCDSSLGMYYCYGIHYILTCWGFVFLSWEELLRAIKLFQLRRG